MNLSFNRENDNNKSLIDFKDPFIKEKCEVIEFRIENYKWNKSTVFKSTIYFSNGNTRGNHNIIANDFNQLVKLTEEFIKSL